MIASGTYPPISIGLGSNEPGKTLQYRYVEKGQVCWRDYLVDGETLKSSVDIDVLPAGVYRLISPTH